MGAMYLYMQEHSVHSLIQPLYLWVQCIYMQERSVHSLKRSYTHCGHKFLQLWPRANWAVVTNNLTVIIEVVLIEGFKYTIPHYSNSHIHMHFTNIAIQKKLV